MYNVLSAKKLQFKETIFNKKYIDFIKELKKSHELEIKNITDNFDKIILEKNKEISEANKKLQLLENKLISIQDNFKNIEYNLVFGLLKFYFIDNLSKQSKLDCMTCIVDPYTKKFLAYSPSKAFNLEDYIKKGLKNPQFSMVGFDVPAEDEVLQKTISTGEIFPGIVPEGAYTELLIKFFPDLKGKIEISPKFRAYGLPIRDSAGKLIFIIGVTHDMTNEEILPQIIASIEEMRAGSQQILNHVTSNKEIIDTLHKVAIHSMNDGEKLDNDISRINNVINIIIDIFDKINLLSLNASIEAARAGEAGRGFGVVGDEISKLADQSDDSIKLITEITQAITATAHNSKKTVENINNILNKLITSNDDFTSMYEQLMAQFDSLENMAKKISLVE